MKRIAVVGCGPSGLCAIKACKEEGMDVICFERSDGVGGLWKYHDTGEEGRPSVMKSTVINTHKEVSSFSDFPPPEDLPNYMHNTQMLGYFELYAEHFKLRGHIHFNQEVINIAEAKDYDDTGRWTVRVKDLVEQTISEQTFDGVMLCIGHHVYPHIPKFEGQENFQGKIMHSHSLKVPEPFKDMNVLVVGIGNSAVDAAVDISNVAKQVYLSTRRGAWIMPRSGPRGLSFDGLFSNRFSLYIWKIIGWRLAAKLMEIFFLTPNFDHEFYGIKPKHGFLNQHPTINDYIKGKIFSGQVLIRKNIKMFVKNGVIFEGTDTVTPVDAVIFATGYDIKFPFLDYSVFRPNKNKVDLYKFTFSAELKHPTLAVIGMIQPFGSIFPISDTQSRWAALVMNGKVRLPSIEKMRKSIRRRREQLNQQFVDTQRHTVQVSYLGFMEEIAEEYGVKPNMLKLAVTDPYLFYACLFGLGVPYQYRLEGPHAWAGAREAILQVPKRINKPLSGGVSVPNYQVHCNLRGTWQALLFMSIISISIFAIFWFVISYIIFYY